MALGLAGMTACGGDNEAEVDDQMPATEAAPAAANDDPDVAPPGESAGLPAGFELRLDGADATPADFHVAQQDGGFHVETGPAGVFYDPNATPAGDYTVSATFSENRENRRANHREAYGIVIGGSDLQGPGQQYTYFLVRADGQYLIKKRAGSETMNVGDGWTAADAVHKAEGDAGPPITNMLEVKVAGDQVHFSVNGQEVATLPAAQVDAHGIAGIRVNHNHDVTVTDWKVQ
jgi:hypothetical protein